MVTEVDQILAPVLPDRYDGKLLAVARVEGMDDAKDSIAIVSTGCNRRRRQTLMRKGLSGRSRRDA